MRAFTNAVRAETRKLLTVRLWWLLLLILFGYVGFTAGILGGIFGALSDSPAGQRGYLPTAGLAPLVYSVATSVGYVFPLLLGVLATTTEFRHQTLTPTFLADPRRGRVLGSKMIVLAVFGAVFGVVGLLASMGIGGSLLAATGQDTALADGDTWVLVARVVLAMAIWAVLGVGLGVMIPSQVGAIVVVLAFTQFVEPILRAGTSIWEWTAQIGKFLPGAAGDALVGSSVFTALGGGTTNVAVLEWWQGGLVLLGYALVVSLIGYAITWRRDVT